MPRLVHVSSMKTLGGVAEVITAEIAALGRVAPDVRVDWVNPVKDSTVNELSFLVNKALYGAGVVGELRQAPPWAPLRAWAEVEGPRLAAAVGRADAIVLHDPLCLLLAPALRPLTGVLAWRCHHGDDGDHPDTRLAVAGLLPYLDSVDLVCFLRKSFVWTELDPARALVVPAGIDPGSPRNAEPAPELAAAAGALRTGGRLPGDGPLAGDGPLLDAGGSGFLRDPGTPYVLQVSRWDPLKGFPGVLTGFAAVAGDHPDLELVLLGPYVDPDRHHPDNIAVRDGLLARRARLPAAVRDRVHVWSFRPGPREREASAVNLLQRGATVVVQNSVREAFGLTVTEAMWKRATVLAADVGGIRDQIVDGVNGLLSADTDGGPAWTARLEQALADPAGRTRWGAAAHRTVRDRHLAGTAVRIQLDAFGWPIGR